MGIQVQIEGKGMVAEFPDGTDPAVIDAAIKRDYFSDNKKTAKPSFYENVKEFTKPLVRPTLEYGGMMLGGAGGMLSAGPPGAVVGAGLGYAAGRQAANLYEGKEVPLINRFGQLPEDISSGMQMEMAGQGLGVAIGAGGKYIANRVAPRLYESTLKAPPGTVRLADREAAVKAALESKIAPTKGGLNKLRSEIDDINNAIGDIINASSRQGQPVQMAEVVKRTNELKASYANLPPGRAQEFLKDIDKVESQYLTSPQITIKQAQEMKKKIYELHRKHYGELKSAEIEAEKQIARGLKEEIVSQVPEIASLNERDSARIVLENLVERAVKRSRNWDILGLTDLVGGSIGGAMGGHSGDWKKGGEGAALGMMVTRALREPAVAARLAFAINKARVIDGKLISRPITYESLRKDNEQNP